MGVEEFDHLTRIYNQGYLEKNYLDYITSHRNSTLVMIDFQKFKKINDTYGHNEGDKCLKVFAQHLQSTFDDSITCRLHGDEFCIVTSHTEEEIADLLCTVRRKIEFSHSNNQVPLDFSFNAGSVVCSPNLNRTMEVADVMMYDAKATKKLYQPFSKEVYEKRESDTQKVDLVNSLIQDASFSYSRRFFFDIEGNQTAFSQIFTKGQDGNSIFGRGDYAKLRELYDLSKFDCFNIQNVMGTLQKSGYPVFVNLDSVSLAKNENIYKFFAEEKDRRKCFYGNVVLCIDLNSLDEANYGAVVNNINNLRKLGFQICLDKVESGLSLKTWEDCLVDYVKFNHTYWKRALYSPKVGHSLVKNIELVSEFGDPSRVVFGYIENVVEFSMLRDHSPSNTLFSGSYFSDEEPFSLRKKFGTKRIDNKDDKGDK